LFNNKQSFVAASYTDRAAALELLDLSAMSVIKSCTQIQQFYCWKIVLRLCL